jgi:hypothetical protein
VGIRKGIGNCILADDALMDKAVEIRPEETARSRATRSWGIADEWSVMQPDPAIGAMVFLPAKSLFSPEKWVDAVYYGSKDYKNHCFTKTDNMSR